MPHSFETIKKLMYKTFKNGFLDELDLEDLEQVWVTLIIFWNLEQYFFKDHKNDIWAEFIDEINSVKSEDEKWFNEIFEKYFENDNHR
jgi:hypothetical protein